MTVGVNRDQARAEAAAAGRQVLELLARLLWGLGWLVARTLKLALAAVGYVFWSIGWLGRRAVWPALRWCWSAILVGWADGRRPGDEGGRGRRR